MFGPRNMTAVVLGIIVVLLVVVGIPIMGWQLGWWLNAQGTNKQAHINSSSYGAQQSDITSISNNMQAIAGNQHDLITAPAGTAQSIHVEILSEANTVCQYSTYLTGSIPLDSSTAAFVKANCTGDAVSATSTLRNGTGS